MSCCRSCIDCLPVLAVLALFAYVYYTYVVVLCMHTLEYLVQRIIYSLIFHIFFFMALLSYFITMCKEHEYVPSYYKLPTMDYEMFKIAGTEDEKNRILDGFCRSRAIRIYTTTATGAIRFCSKCKHVKPDRTHHCSTCKTCIPKMDHHCPWVNNCVGFANYKIFIVFLTYTALTCIFVTATLLEHFTYYWITDTNNINDHQLLALFVFAVCLVIILLSFLLYHLSLISKNQTTLEALREPQFKEGSLSFDLGCRSNFEEVFGDNWECWFCPKNTSLGDGFEFPLQVDI